MSCNCSTHCDPLHTGHGWPCICIYIYDEHRCICQCSDNPPFEPHAVVLKTLRADASEYGDDPETPVYVHAVPTEAATRRRLALEAKVDLCVTNATVGDIGALLASLSLADIAIPAARVTSNLSMTLEAVPLGTALGRVGLVVLETKPVEAAQARD